MVAFALRNWQAVIGAIGCAVLGFLLLTARGQRDSWQRRAVHGEHVLETSALRIRAATAKMQLAATTFARAIERRDDALRTEIDNAHAANLAAARVRADAYARTHFMRAPLEAAGSDRRTADDPAPRPSPESPDGPGPRAFVAVTRDDFDICTENTVRLLAGRDWALRRPMMPEELTTP